MTKTAFIAIVGCPNVGKSSILNRVLGTKIAIVSSKPQTTRTKIMGVLTEGETQLVFTDTPGYHKPHNKLGEKMNQAVGDSIGGVDACLFVVEAKGDIKKGAYELLEKFKKDTNSVLFATDSFWEGVDVPGSSLSQVIIVKLPFAVPNDPVFSARSEALEKKGGNPFMQLSLPQAVIKFRQGFGRLVRRADDKGIIVVLDRRIVEKKYGGIFTRSVPMTKRMYSPLDAILHAVENFFN